MAGIDTNRTTAGIELPKNLASEIWAGTVENSVVQQLVPQFEMPAGGSTIQTITGEPEANWVNETDEKPVSQATFGSKVLQPYKLAVIELFSDEFRRDLPALYRELERRLPYSIGRKFDRTALGYDAAPGENFDTLAAAPEIALDGTMSGYFGAVQSVTSNAGDVTGWALTPSAELDAMQISGNDGRPLLTQNLTTDASVGNILARPVHKYKTIGNDPVVGFAGEWTSAAWGSVEGIKIKISDQATINKDGVQVNLWQRNMFAVLVEAEMGFRVRDVKRFAKLTKAAAASEPAATV